MARFNNRNKKENEAIVEEVENQEVSTQEIISEVEKPEEEIKVEEQPKVEEVKITTTPVKAKKASTKVKSSTLADFLY